MATAPTPPAPATSASPFIDWVARNRRQLGLVLLAVGLGFLVLAGTWLVQREAAVERAAPKPPSETVGKEELPPPPSPGGNSRVFWAGLLGLLALAAGLVPLARVPVPGQEKFEARVWVMSAGGVAGLLTALFGLVLLYNYRNSLYSWIAEGQTREARRVLLAVAVMVAGLLVTFASLQPARAEERTSAVMRRLLYGFNTALLGVLLLLVLSAGNVFAFLKLPNALDTTESGFYSLSPRGREFLAELKQPVHAYLVMPDTGTAPYTDLRVLLNNCEEASPYFKATFLSPAVNRLDIQSLYQRLKLPDTDRNRMGLVVTVGEHEEQTGFIPLDEMVSRDERGSPVFQGEAKLLTELSWLAEGRKRPVIYFTQGFGELDLNAASDDPTRTAANLKRYLTERKFDVRPLKFDPSSPPNLEDATAVVIAGPRQTFSSAAAQALRDYMTPPPGKDGAPRAGGKLLALLPPHPGPKGKVPPTGLESLLGEFGVQLSNEFLVSDPRETVREGFPPTLVEIMANPSGAGGRNPITQSLGRSVVESLYVRPVQGSGEGQFQSVPLLLTNARIPLWHETDFDINVVQVFRQILRDPRFAKEKRWGLQNDPVGVLVSEGGRPRLAVYGTASFASDALTEQAVERIRHLGLVGNTLDWLRERPSNIGIEPRAYRNYSLDKNVDAIRLLVVPLGLTCLAVIGLGAGIWLVRRR